MKKVLSIGVVFLLLLNVVIAQQVKIHDSGNNSFSVVSSNTGQITMDISFNDISFFNVQSSEGEFCEIVVPGYSNTQQHGLPKLPVLRRIIEVPHGASLYVKVINKESEEVSLESLGMQHRIIPAQPPVAKSNTAPQDLVINHDTYAQDAFFNSNPAAVEEIGFMRGTRLARVDINPVSYNPATGMLNVITKMEVQVTFNNGDMGVTNTEKNRTQSPYFSAMDKFVLNADEFKSKDEITQYPVKYVIVADPMFQIPLTQFVNWKKQKGYTVVEAYTNNPEVGNTTSSIKAYLTDLYQSGTTWDPAPTFVLFVGDVEQVPAHSMSGHVSDLYYCEYTGDDIPEVYYGRFSATSVEHVEAMVQKTVSYEKYQMPDPSYLNECVMISGADASHAPTWGNGQINYGTQYYFNESHGLTSHTYLYPESSNHSADIIQHVSDGVCYANYTAHGNWDGWSDPSFKNNDVPGLQNENKYCLMVGNCCLTNKFEQGSCFGETLLRAENKGALGYIGGSNSTYWDEDFYWGVGVGSISANPTYEGTDLGAYDKTFHDHGEPYSEWFTTQGQMMYAGNMAVEQGSPSNSTYYWEIYHLMGDPSVSIYFSQPLPSSTTYDELMPIGTETFEVQTEPYSLVAISFEGELCGTAQANPSGVAMVNLNPINTVGEADIVVTGQNRVPFFGTVTIAGAPGVPVNVLPQDGSDDVSIFTDFAWEEGFGGIPENYTLSLGSDNPPTNILNDIVVSDTFYLFSENLEFNTTYYWQVKATNSYGTVAGDVWTFTTKDVPEDDFESGDFTTLPWYFAGDENWIIDGDVSLHGEYAARSGEIDDNQTSSLVIDLDCNGFESMSFWVKVSCENESDRLEFYLDGQMQKMWYGEKEWAYAEYFIGPGPHTAEWKYIKGDAGSAGDDCAWIDMVYLPVDNTMSCNAGSDGEVCEGASYTLNGTAFNYQTVLWSTSGDGTFDDNTVLKPEYTPGSDDISNGEVILTLEVSDGTDQTSDDMTLYVHALPAISETPEGPVFVDLYYQTSTEYEVEEISGAESYLWILEPENAGELVDNAQQCTVNWSEEFVGTATLTVQGSNFCGNGEISLPLEIVVDNSVGENSILMEEVIRVYPNPNKGEFVLVINNPAHSKQAVSVIDAVGNIVFYTMNTKKHLEVRNLKLKAGIYFVKVSDNADVKTAKIVVAE
jgi:hypothetical protein